MSNGISDLLGVFLGAQLALVGIIGQQNSTQTGIKPCKAPQSERENSIDLHRQIRQSQAVNDITTANDQPGLCRSPNQKPLEISWELSSLQSVAAAVLWQLF